MVLPPKLLIKRNENPRATRSPFLAQRLTCPLPSASSPDEKPSMAPSSSTRVAEASTSSSLPSKPSSTSRRLRLPPPWYRCCPVSDEVALTGLQGLSLTAFKSARRRLGISRWPYERKASGDKKIAAAQRKPRRGRDSGRTGTGGRQDEDVEDGTGPLDPEWIAWYMTTSEDGGLS